MYPILNFAGYFITALVLLMVFMYTYEKFTPYREFSEINNGNIAAAITFAGAILGFTFPLVSAIYFTRDVLEMAKWAVFTMVVQLAVFWFINRLKGYAAAITLGKPAPAIFLASMSIAVGLLNAVCISF